MFTHDPEGAVAFTGDSSDAQATAGFGGKGGPRVGGEAAVTWGRKYPDTITFSYRGAIISLPARKIAYIAGPVDVPNDISGSLSFGLGEFRPLAAFGPADPLLAAWENWQRPWICTISDHVDARVPDNMLQGLVANSPTKYDNALYDAAAVVYQYATRTTDQAEKDLFNGLADKMANNYLYLCDPVTGAYIPKRDEVRKIGGNYAAYVGDPKYCNPESVAVYFGRTGDQKALNLIRRMSDLCWDEIDNHGMWSVHATQWTERYAGIALMTHAVASRLTNDPIYSERADAVWESLLLCQAAGTTGALEHLERQHREGIPAGGNATVWSPWMALLASSAAEYWCKPNNDDRIGLFVRRMANAMRGEESWHTYTFKPYSIGPTVTLKVPHYYSLKGHPPGLPGAQPDPLNRVHAEEAAALQAQAYRYAKAAGETSEATECLAWCRDFLLTGVLGEMATAYQPGRPVWNELTGRHPTAVGNPGRSITWRLLRTGLISAALGGDRLSPDVSAVATVPAGTRPLPGDTVPVTVRVRNDGASHVSEVTVTPYLRTRYDSATGKEFVVVSGTLSPATVWHPTSPTWALHTLAPGQEVVLTFSVKYTGPDGPAASAARPRDPLVIGGWVKWADGVNAVTTSLTRRGDEYGITEA